MDMIYVARQLEKALVTLDNFFGRDKWRITGGNCLTESLNSLYYSLTSEEQEAFKKYATFPERTFHYEDDEVQSVSEQFIISKIPDPRVQDYLNSLLEVYSL